MDDSFNVRDYALGAGYGTGYHGYWVQNYMKIVPDSKWSYWQLHHCLLADLSGYNQHDPLISGYLISAGTGISQKS